MAKFMNGARTIGVQIQLSLMTQLTDIGLDEVAHGEMNLSYAAQLLGLDFELIIVATIWVFGFAVASLPRVNDAKTKKQRILKFTDFVCSTFPGFKVVSREWLRPGNPTRRCGWHSSLTRHDLIPRPHDPHRASSLPHAHRPERLCGPSLLVIGNEPRDDPPSPAIYEHGEHCPA